MQIVIEIPEEFEDHFNSDRFEDALYRLSEDTHLIAGNYEQETAIMLIEALKNAVLLPEGHGRLIDADELKESEQLWSCDYEPDGYSHVVEIQDIDTAPTIIEADKED